MSREIMQQALDAFEDLKKSVTRDGTVPENWDAYYEKEYYALEALRQAIEQAEKQEPDLPPVFIGVDVTLKGTQVNAFYRRPNDVAEMFYSEFHPLAKPEQEPVAWMLPEYGDVLPASQADGTGIYNIPLYTAPPKPEQESISTNDHLCAMLRQVHDVLACTALPMKRQWVGLTDDEIEEAWGNTPMMLNARDGGSRKMFARAIEAKLKEKNT